MSLGCRSDKVGLQSFLFLFFALGSIATLFLTVSLIASGFWAAGQTPYP